MKKGFTLIELLGVLAIITVIATIAVIAVDNSIRKGKITTCKAQEDSIIEAAKTWQTDNPIESNTKVYINNPEETNDLTKLGYLDENLKNPMTNEVYKSNSYVEIKVNKNSDSEALYTYTINYTEESSCE